VTLVRTVLCLGVARVGLALSCRVQEKTSSLQAQGAARPERAQAEESPTNSDAGVLQAQFSSLGWCRPLCAVVRGTWANSQTRVARNPSPQDSLQRLRRKTHTASTYSVLLCALRRRTSHRPPRSGCAPYYLCLRRAVSPDCMSKEPAQRVHR